MLIFLWALSLSVSTKNVCGCVCVCKWVFISFIVMLSDRDGISSFFSYHGCFTVSIFGLF